MGQSRKALKHSISAQYAESLFKTCTDLGVAPDKLYNVLNASKTDFSNPLERYDCDAVLDMIAYAQTKTGNRSIGLLAGKNFRPSTFVDVGQAFISANSLRHSLAVNAKYQRLTQQFGNTHLKVEKNIARVLWTPYIEDAERLRPITEAVYAGYVTIGRWLLWHYNEDALIVNFRHAKPAEKDPCEEYFGCKINYGQDRDSLDFKGELADAKNPQANPELLKTLETRLDRALENLDNLHRYTNQVNQCINFMLGQTPVSIGTVANKLGYSETQLARNLKDEQSSFRDILKDIRKQTAEFYLKQERQSLANIALALGYSDQSAFTRAYKSWHGRPPSKNK